MKTTGIDLLTAAIIKGIIRDSDQLDTHLLYFTVSFFVILYMFRALYAHHQDVELY